MSIKLLSFDAQGTLCSHDFSSEVWLTLLPREILACGGERGNVLLERMRATPNDDPRYYDIDHWLKLAGSPLSGADLSTQSRARPRLFPEMIELIKSLREQVTLVVLSATTRGFLDQELGAAKALFDLTYSTFDDFGAAGKPPRVFGEMARSFGVTPEECLHVGDHAEHDGANPRLAGWRALYQPSDCTPAERAGEVARYLYGERA